MRKIAFRAWDKKRKEMCYEVDIYGNEKAFEWTGQWRFENGDKDCFFDNTNKENSLMQFTGLLDKNGKEIYEGDIIAFNETVMSDVGEDKPNYIEKRSDKGFIYADGKRGKRKYGREIKVVEWKEKSCGFEPFSDSDDNCGHCGGGDSPKSCEIIGNIYSNPELLN